MNLEFHISHLKGLLKRKTFQISNLKSLAEEVSRQLRGWADSLQNSEIKGQRYLNERERKKFQNQKEQAEFEKLLESYKKNRKENLSSK